VSFPSLVNHKTNLLLSLRKKKLHLVKKSESFWKSNAQKNGNKTLGRKGGELVLNDNDELVAENPSDMQV